MTRLLIVYDGLFDICAFHRLMPQDCRTVSIIQLRPNPGFQQTVESWFHNQSIPCEVVPFSRFLNDNALKVRDKYLQYIFGLSQLDIGKKTLADFLRYPFSWHSSWWFTLVAEKNPFKSESFRWFVTIDTILETIERRSIDCVFASIGDTVVLKSLEVAIQRSFAQCRFVVPLRKAKRHRYVYIALQTCVRMIAFWRRVRTGMKGRRKRMRKFSDARMVFATYFPNIDKDAFKRGCFLSQYFPPLQRAAESKYVQKTSTVALGVDVGGMTKFEAIETANYLNEGGANIVFLEEAMTILGFCASFFATLHLMAKYFMVLPTIRRQLSSDGAPALAELWAHDLKMSFALGGVTEGHLYTRAFTKLLSRIRERCNIAYVAEMHGWERALNAAVRHFPNCRAVGMQHAAISLLQLNFFEHPQGMRWGGGTSDPLLPDRFGCAGTATYEIMKRSGWPEARLFILGSLRMSKPDVRKSAKSGADCMWGKNTAITVALSISAEESCEVLNFVHEAIRDTPGVVAYVKTHPATPLGVLKGTGHLSEGIEKSSRFLFSDENMADLLDKSHAMVVAGSSSCFNALACCKRVIVPLLSGSVCLNPLYGLSNYAEYVSSPVELREVLSSNPGWEQRCYTEDLFSSFFEVHDDDGEYLKRVESSHAGVQWRSGRQ